MAASYYYQLYYVGLLLLLTPFKGSVVTTQPVGKNRPRLLRSVKFAAATGVHGAPSANCDCVLVTPPTATKVLQKSATKTATKRHLKTEVFNRW